MKHRLPLAAVAAFALLTACGRQAPAGGLSAEEERQLDNAAAMLDHNSVFEVPSDSMVANEAEIAAQEGAAPANAAGNATGNRQ